MEKLTDRQAAVLEEIKKFMAKKGYAPTVREICKKVDLSSTATVQMHLTKLQEKGYIRKEISVRLSLRITPQFNFVIDNSLEEGDRIINIMNNLK